MRSLLARIVTVARAGYGVFAYPSADELIAWMRVSSDPRKAPAPIEPGPLARAYLVRRTR